MLRSQCGTLAEFARRFRGDTPPGERVRRLRAAGCAPRAPAFRELLKSTSVVIVACALLAKAPTAASLGLRPRLADTRAFATVDAIARNSTLSDNPQHYEGRLDWWRYDLESMLPILREWVAGAAGRVAIVREPPAQHFEGGAFVPGQRQFVSPTRGCCRRLSAAEAFGDDNVNYAAARAVREAVGAVKGGRVHVLPYYNVTLRRWHAHIATRAACFARREHTAEWTRKRECSCDCTHLCYSPLFYDAAILTPLHELLI